MKNYNASKYITREEGFTFIELLVAMGVLSIGILAVTAMQITAFQGNNSARLQTEAVTLITGKIEALLSGGYYSLSDGSESAADFSLNWTVADDTPVTDTRTLRVSASWIDRGKLKTVDVSRIVYNDG